MTSKCFRITINYRPINQLSVLLNIDTYRYSISLYLVVLIHIQAYHYHMTHSITSKANSFVSNL